MDLGSTNGTFLNGERLEPERYYELLEKVRRGAGTELGRNMPGQAGQAGQGNSVVRRPQVGSDSRWTAGLWR